MVKFLRCQAYNMCCRNSDTTTMNSLYSRLQSMLDKQIIHMHSHFMPPSKYSNLYLVYLSSRGSHFLARRPWKFEPKQFAAITALLEHLSLRHDIYFFY